MRNPFKRHDAAATVKPGWDTIVTRDVARAGEAPLRLSLRLPGDIRLVELADLVAAARGAPTWLDDQMQAFQDAAERAGTVLVGAIVPADTPNDVLATVTVLYSRELEGGPFEIREPAPGERVKQHVLRVSDAVTVVRRLSAVQLEPAAELVGQIVEEYLVRYALGGLAVAFTTTHAGMGGDRGNDFFSDVVASISLTEAQPG